MMRNSTNSLPTEKEVTAGSFLGKMIWKSPLMQLFLKGNSQVEKAGSGPLSNQSV